MSPTSATAALGDRTRIPLLYLAPWVDIGGTDKNTIDWFRWIDRERFAPSLICTQPSANRRLGEIAELAEEVWVLPDLMSAEEMPAFILDFVVSRQIEVVHLMNSRLGFDLLPDLTSIPGAPGIVVHLHVEEADRSGYVRYVTTRYGNLVDRFSVTSNHLAGAVQEYGVPHDRIKVIYIGVDGDGEFNPDRVDPIEGLDRERLQILFPSRIVQQKDPLLMVEVARALRDRGVEFEVHVLGEGDLEDDVRARLAEYDLGDRVLLHPPTAAPQRWYAATDVLLLTSEFEGVPASVYEAMAMAQPIVASALPGNAELLGSDYPGLIENRHEVGAYVEALARLASDPAEREAQGRALRETALERYSLEQMVADHAVLYEEVAAARGVDSGPDPLPEPIRFLDRPLLGNPLVSVLIPHYNQSNVLAECVNSVWTQTYPNVELVVVDDCSTDADAPAQLDELEAQDDVTVLRLDRNGGPSRARNLGLDHCSGRYVLPVDADNVLLPDAIERLVEQLSAAGEETGFIYPNLQYFGNREDYYEPPEFNVYTLLHGNFCDTCSLIDRQVFDAGLRYREEIVLGHEDWDFVLRLAAHGIRGERAHVPTVRYRKWGFNRSDAVDNAPTPFDETLRELSPFAGHEAEVKAREAPALSLICLAPVGDDPAARAKLAQRLARQSSSDFELFAVFEGAWPELPQIPQVRRLPGADSGDALDVLRRARHLARGRFLAISVDPELELLADPGLIEKALRRFTARTETADAVVLTDRGEQGAFSFGGADSGAADPAAAHTLLWRAAAEQELPFGLHADGGDPVRSIARALSGSGARVEWRHAPGAAPPPQAAAEAQPIGPLGPAAVANALVEPLLPGADRPAVPRWEVAPSWTPPLSTVLVRYRDHLSERRLVTTGRPPFGYIPEYHLGSPRSVSVEGTERLIRVGDGFETRARGEWQSLPDDAEELGYLEEAPLPQFKVLAVGVYRLTGQHVIVSLPDDPLVGEVDVIRSLGFVEPFPIEPLFEPPQGPSLGLVGLVKSVDTAARRHRYALGAVPPGELAGELGGLADSELYGSIPAWIVDGWLITDRHAPPPMRANPLRTARWVAEPATWRGIADPKARAKTTLRRSGIAAARLAVPSNRGLGQSRTPEAWLFDEYRPGLTPLYASYHPVTGDQLLTRSAHDGPQMGYLTSHLLGYARLGAPVTGETEPRIFPVPWARRFGAVPRIG